MVTGRDRQRLSEEQEREIRKELEMMDADERAMLAGYGLPQIRRIRDICYSDIQPDAMSALLRLEGFVNIADDIDRRLEEYRQYREKHKNDTIV